MSTQNKTDKAAAPFIENRGRLGAVIIWPDKDGWVSSMPDVETAEKLLTSFNEHAALVAVAEAAKPLVTPHKGGRFAGELQREHNALRKALANLAAVRGGAK